jgi:hypothetical protein
VNNIFPGVNRVELIDNDGRRYVKYDVVKVDLALQDANQTLKIFVEYNKEDEISDD